MKKSEQNKIIKWAESLTDEELEEEYYKLSFETLGSQVERMYELDYSYADIKEREEYEKFIAQTCDLLENLCINRGINLFE